MAISTSDAEKIVSVLFDDLTVEKSVAVKDGVIVFMAGPNGERVMDATYLVDNNGRLVENFNILDYKDELSATFGPFARMK